MRADRSQAPVFSLVDELLTAERELAAFYAAVLKTYGPVEAQRAVQDWIEVLERMDWPVGGVLPKWRQVTIFAAGHLASRVIDHTQGSV